LFQDHSARYDALRFLAGDTTLPGASRTPEVQQYLGNGVMFFITLMFMGYIGWRRGIA